MKKGKDSTALQQLRSLLASGESNEDLVMQITDLFPALIYVYDAEKRKLRYINRRITDLLGFEWEDVSAWDNDLNQLIFKDDLPLMQLELEKYYQLEGHTSHSYNCRFNHKGGEFRYFKTVGTVLRRNDSGLPDSMLFMAQDITEQVRIEQEKLAAMELMDDTEKMLKTGVWNLDHATGKMEWSEGMYALLGYTREELPSIDGSWFMAHIFPEERSHVEAKINGAMETGEAYSIDFSLNRKDGSRLFVNSVGKPVKDADGHVLKITGINRDISDQYLKNLEYRANKDLLQQTEQMLNYGVFIWDIQQNSSTWTDGLYDIFEVDQEERKGIVSSAWYGDHVLEEDREKLRECVYEAVSLKTGFECEYTIITAKGNLRMVSSKGNMILDNDQVAIRMVGNTRDITPFKKVENELKRNLRELNRSNMELEEFAYAASHDMQEPLRKITTFGSRLKHKYGDLLGEEGQMYIDRMQVASDNMRTLIDNLLELSRVSRTAQIFEPVDLTRLAREAISVLEIAIDESGATIELEQLPTIDGIPAQLRQMFTNLIGNALKFSRHNTKPLIQIRAFKLGRKAKENHYLLPDKNYQQIDITDNGIGFDQEYEDKIFQIFQRLHGKSEYPGSGIGLSICKRIAERHKGVISAHGKTGQGATFSVILPENQ